MTKKPIQDGYNILGLREWVETLKNAIERKDTTLIYGASRYIKKYTKDILENPKTEGRYINEINDSKKLMIRGDKIGKKIFSIECEKRIQELKKDMIALGRDIDNRNENTIPHSLSHVKTASTAIGYYTNKTSTTKDLIVIAENLLEKGNKTYNDIITDPIRKCDISNINNNDAGIRRLLDMTDEKNYKDEKKKAETINSAIDTIKRAHRRVKKDNPKCLKTRGYKYSKNLVDIITNKTDPKLHKLWKGVYNKLDFSDF